MQLKMLSFLWCCILGLSGLSEAMPFRNLKVPEKTRFTKLRSLIHDKAVEEQGILDLICFYLKEAPLIGKAEDSEGKTLLSHALCADRKLIARLLCEAETCNQDDDGSPTVAPDKLLGDQAPKGLINRNNSCFINAVVQAIASCKDLSTKILDLDQFAQENSLSELLQTALVHYRTAEETKIHLESLHEALWNLLRIPSGEQGDANECLALLLNHITNHDIKKEHRPLLAPCRDGLTPKTAFSDSLFVSTTCQQISLKDRFLKKNSERTVGILHKIGEGDTSLDHCLKGYFAGLAEPVRVPNGEFVEVKNRRFLQETQQYLVIMLDRVTHFETETGLESYRRATPLSFPLKNLDMGKYALNKNNSKGAYTLNAVILHDGTEKIGHYTAYTRWGKTWYYCNDSSIKAITDEEMIKIANQGYGRSTTTVPTTLIYELSSTQAQ